MDDRDANDLIKRGNGGSGGIGGNGIKYFDWNGGTTQCFEYLLEMSQNNDALFKYDQDDDSDSKNDTTKKEESKINEKQKMVKQTKDKKDKGKKKKNRKKNLTQVSLYPTVVYDCTIYGRVKLMEVLLKACKKYHYNLVKNLSIA